MYFLKFTYTLLYRSFYIFIKRKKEAKWGAAYLQSLQQNFNGKFDERTFKKILFYYSLMVPAICDAFLQLHNRKTNHRERERLLHYFLCTSIFDNFFDRNELTDDEIFNITFNPQKWQPKNFNESISLNSHNLLSSFVKDKTYYKGILKKVYDVQVASRKQFDENITYQELEHITIEKGGNAVLLTALFLDHQSNAIELEARFILGAIIQFVNDLYDIYRDLQNGIETIPTRLTSIEPFKTNYLQLVTKLKDKLNEIDASSNNKLSLKISLMSICALGIIAIEQLEKLQDNSHQLPNLKTVARKSLIIDMEKFSNLYKFIKTTYLLSK